MNVPFPLPKNMVSVIPLYRSSIPSPLKSPRIVDARFAVCRGGSEGSVSLVGVNIRCIGRAPQRAEQFITNGDILFAVAVEIRGIQVGGDNIVGGRFDRCNRNRRREGPITISLKGYDVLRNGDSQIIAAENGQIRLSIVIKIGECNSIHAKTEWCRIGIASAKCAVAVAQEYLEAAGRVRDKVQLKTAGTSFTITASTAPTSHPACLVSV
jgi:hypothetical protein